MFYAYLPSCPVCIQMRKRIVYLGPDFEVEYVLTTVSEQAGMSVSGPSSRCVYTWIEVDRRFNVHIQSKLL